MFCFKCGNENPDGSKFCINCGAHIGATENSGNVLSASVVNDEQNTMTFGKALATCLAKYADFKGRASRPEYWWFYLFTVLLSWGAMLVDHTQVLSMLVSLALFLPSFAAGARRLHDTNRSGWWQLIALTIIGIVPLVIWLASKGGNQENQYGSIQLTVS